LRRAVAFDAELRLRGANIGRNEIARPASEQPIERGRGLERDLPASLVLHSDEDEALRTSFHIVRDADGHGAVTPVALAIDEGDDDAGWRRRAHPRRERTTEGRFERGTSGGGIFGRQSGDGGHGNDETEDAQPGEEPGQQ
jgi:hypothetical protein